MQWRHGFVIASLSWIILMLLCSIPYRLSGNCNSIINACFDVMSGFTTTGLSLTQDLDHLSIGLNMWRHILTFVGGQGMVVMALTFLFEQMSGAYKIYVGEAKDIEIVPNTKSTTRIIWQISLIYLVIGTFIFWVVGIKIGLNPISAFLHGLYMFESSWSTGGFAPMSQNMLYYHSFAYETVSVVFFILGSFNFGLHYAIWQGKKKELYKNIEIQSFFVTVLLSCSFAVITLSKTGIYKNSISIYRKVIYHVLSAHTTTGLGTLYAKQFANEWGEIGIIILTIVMLIGGSACSTAGGFKGLRVGIVFKGLINDIKSILTSERSIKIYKYHYIKDKVLDDKVVRNSALIIICYIILFTLGTIIGVFYDYPLSESAFEAASVSGNVGLSIGVTSLEMPKFMKIYYIIAMYIARLEFLSVFALVGYVIGGMKKLCLKIL